MHSAQPDSTADTPNLQQKGLYFSLSFMSAIIYYLALPFIYLVSYLPFRVMYLFSDILYILVYKFFGYRKKVVTENLQKSFPDKSATEIDKIRRDFYRYFCDLSLESIKTLSISPTTLKKHFRHDDISRLERYFRDGQSVILVMGHLGNWELQGAAAAAIIKSPVTVAATKQSNPYINRFITQRRNELGMQVAGSKGARRLLLKALKNHEAIALVADQNAGRDAVFVDFFGKLAATQPGPAQLALKYKAPIIVAATIRTGPGKFKIIHQEVEIEDDDTVESLTQRHVKILEGFIRQYPEQYFWLHRRWKRRPEGELKIED